MAFSEDYNRLVVEDIKRYKGLSRPVRSSWLMRRLVRRLPLTALHPNPEDEFCDPAIGPNDGIVNKYIQDYRRNLLHGNPPVEEKLTVEKMSTGGYMLLNGHHRWLAAARIKLETLPVEVINSITEEEVIARMNRSERHMCVSFDLDEVLLTDANGPQADHKLPFFYRHMFRQTLRKNAGALINELQNLGFDVWVYSGRGAGEDEIRRLFSLHKAKVDGLVHVLKGKKASHTLAQAFRDKYALSLHIDNEAVLWVDTRTREYDTVPVAGGEAWSADVFAKVCALDRLKALRGEAAHA